MEIYNSSATLPPEALLAFAKSPHRMIIRPGEELFRFGTIVSRTFAGNDVFGSPWWIPGSTYTAIAKTAHRTAKAMSDVARSRLAVAKPWNPGMDWLMVIVLKKPVYAWIGPARSQPVDGRDRSVLLLGNYDQAYVPGLAPPESMSSEAALLKYFGSAQV